MAIGTLNFERLVKSVFTYFRKSSGEDSAVRYGSIWECLAGIQRSIFLNGRYVKGPQR